MARLCGGGADRGEDMARLGGGGADGIEDWDVVNSSCSYLFTCD